MSREKGGEDAPVIDNEGGANACVAPMSPRARAVLDHDDVVLALRSIVFESAVRRTDSHTTYKGRLFVGGCCCNTTPPSSSAKLSKHVHHLRSYVTRPPGIVVTSPHAY